eukprot:6206719-Pleurochrysis_carterae.AAC.1
MAQNKVANYWLGRLVVCNLADSYQASNGWRIRQEDNYRIDKQQSNGQRAAIVMILSSARLASTYENAQYVRTRWKASSGAFR